MKPLEASDGPEVGPYRVVAELGRGGMGRVLLGGTDDGQVVAVKVVHAQLVEDEGFRARFRREVDASRRVSGLHTAAVIDADADAKLPWLASAFVPGPSLREVLDASGALPLRAVLRLAVGLLAALVDVHGARLIHRDLKPSNVLLTADGCRVIDFGIARAADSDGGSEITSTGSLVGSPGFMSPEQAEGRRITPASDMFSFGTMLLLAYTGTSPFAGHSTPQTLYNVVHKEPDLGALPRRLRDIIAPCLAKHPDARPAPAEVLASIGSGEVGSGRPWPPAVHALIDAQQAEAARYLGMSAGDTLVAAADATTIVRTLVGPSLPPAEPQSPADGPDQPPPAGAPSSRPSRRTLLIGTGLAAAVAVPIGWRMFDGRGATGGKGSSATPSTKPAGSKGRPSPTRRPGTLYGPRVTPKHGGVVQCLAFAPDNSVIAVGTSEGAVTLWDSSGPQQTATFDDRRKVRYEGIRDVAFSADGTVLAAAEDSATTLWDVASGKPVARLTDTAYDPLTVQRLAFAPGGAILACANAKGTITLWDAADHTRITTLVDPVARTNGQGKSHTGLVFTADGRTLAACNEAGIIRFWDVSSRRTTDSITTDDSFEGLAYSPDGTMLASATADERVLLWNTDFRSRIGALSFDGGSSNFDWFIHQVAFSHDGKTLAGATGSGLKLWDVATRELHEVPPPVAGEGGASSVAYSPDGTMLAASFLGRLCVWNVA
ncbi:hypothetical protein GCM10010222_58510 [Streptomyces tanashiensis]|uniref:WD40 repeat domain-containing serine/threonine protein kinase n=1 Tax=Streptomyces tanashiensis TaxID=67367 RepID=UPI00167422B2|nr:protein kinase [Streptomyces tanashiensis]GGT08999.1 hypothetical protein GCM10010222_58510 [Streptomyces tanashiensis]